MRTAISTILIVAAIGVFYLFIDPAYQKVKDLRLQAADYNQALDNSAKLRQVRNDLISKYNNLDKNSIDRIQKLLPDGVDNIRLILDINAIASQYGVGLKNIKLAQASTNTTAPAGNANPIGSIQLSFAVSMPYENFVQFLKNIESSLRIVDVVGLSFTQSDKDNVATYNLTLQTYWLK